MHIHVDTPNPPKNEYMSAISADRGSLDVIIRKYVEFNPLNWEADEKHPARSHNTLGTTSCSF